MSSKTNKKKTLGIQNKTWLETLRSLAWAMGISPLFMFYFEFFYMLVSDMTKVRNVCGETVYFHLFGYVLLQTPFAILFHKATESSDKVSMAKWITAFAIVLGLYEFNPWISRFYQQSDNPDFSTFKYTFMLQSIFAPTTVILCVFAVWILLRRAKAERCWEVPYAVICGGEDSTTKRLMAESK